MYKLSLSTGYRQEAGEAVRAGEPPGEPPDPGPGAAAEEGGQQVQVEGARRL